MDVKLWMIFQLLLWAVAVDSFDNKHKGVSHISSMHGNARVIASRGCNNGGSVGDCINEDEELLMESESSRRILAQSKYISYGALKKDSTPCNRRGNSYYNCAAHGQANPYRRGCSAITRCARNTS